MEVQQGQGQGASSSSDFVRKLYKMLEDPSYESVVRWGNEGDSFVVLENEKFTKAILPKHFKHSNFASFVRQLNKYDFHKVRHNNEETGQSPYGPGAWEFKHPDFKANDKDALDNIRRKAPVPKKPNQPSDEAIPTQQMDLVNTQLVATQSQLHQLNERYNELSVHHSMLLQEVMGLQKTVVNHEHVIQNVMSFLHSVDTQQRRNSRLLNNSNPFGQNSDAPNGQMEGPQHQQSTGMDDEPASPLQHATKLLNELNADSVLNTRNLEQMNEMSVRLNANVSTPPPSENAFKPTARQTSRDPPHSASSSSSTMRYGELDNMVYPVGQTNGIDPMYSEHINNIPYPLPSRPPEPTDPRFQPQQPEQRKRHAYDPGWIRQPQILLVEDDPTCRRIGGKFLYAFNCSIDSALDGLEAVNKLNAGSKYDMILMDIIMPNLDGVSACHLVRQFDSTPIIAMTSNIRSDDISMYFQHGMNDVLPKPFTKEGLMTMLDKHLGHLKKHPSNIEHLGGPGRPSVKDEDSPGKSPATLSTDWNSPSQMSRVSPSGNSIHDEYGRHSGAYNMDNGMGPPSRMQYGSTPQQSTGQRIPSGNHRRHISDISGGEDPNANIKRQQMYAPHVQMQGQR